MKIKHWLAKIAFLGVLILILFLITKLYLGYHSFNQYKNARSNAQSIEKSFPSLEVNLKKAVRFYPNPLFFKELARLYLEMALVENESGSGERRDSFLDQSKAALIEQIKRNPIDASAYFEMGKVYMLYNYPLLTFMAKGRLWFRKALEIRPADEFLNLNILYIFLTQWNFLTDMEKNFVFKQLKRKWRNQEGFINWLKNTWRANFKNYERLKEILSHDQILWSGISKYFQ